MVSVRAARREANGRMRCLAAGGILDACQMTKRAVRAAFVVMDPPSLDDPARLGQRAEPVVIEALVAELTDRA